ncbi:unnamed protein product [Taenia asiatica]|uniref:ENTH domain-containing protein n=1 Tax=Taenia asiatica TaxID=60517 RepID=A0A0R3VVZ5_TAEAS|nr:unnamed protein product [Taenia asiatica]
MAARAVKRLAGNGTGQSLVDRMTSMKHSIAGSLIAKTICKATTEEMIAPKRKHLNILVSCTYEPRLSMPEFSNYIIAATMFLFIRHYARYLDARSASYREVAFDFCRIRRK